MTGSGVLVLVTARSADVLTVVVSMAVLLPGTGSVVELVTVAVLLSIVPCAKFALAVATMVNVALAPDASVPMVQFGAVHEPVEGIALTKVNPAGSTSLTETDNAEAGPRLFTVMV